ncbi:6-bladed beta-propeller [Flavisolibacter ginsenosidimutans]|nr:6-bladed beta-propeller [Flavisolibacter ginsenosidimutans]
MERIIGHNNHRYTVDKKWGSRYGNHYSVNDCHEMVIDKNGRLFLLTNEVKNNILVYNKDGRIIDSWGRDYPGGHGLSLHEQGGEEVIFISDHDRHQVIKTDLRGRVLMILDCPKEAGLYSAAEQFLPTETAIADNGDIYVTDGYGLQYVIQYNNKGEYIRHWGGRGNNNEQFDCVHGIAIDNRRSDKKTLLITSRNQNCFKRFTMDGQYIETINLPGSFVCRPVIKDDYLYAAVFRSGSNTAFGSGYITVLDKENKVVSTPGGSAPEYVNGSLLPQHQEEKIFIHPHDVCIDDDKNIYVCQWKAGKTFPLKLQCIA